MMNTNNRGRRAAEVGKDEEKNVVKDFCADVIWNFHPCACRGSRAGWHEPNAKTDQPDDRCRAPAYEQETLRYLRLETSLRRHKVSSFTLKRMMLADACQNKLADGAA